MTTGAVPAAPAAPPADEAPATQTIARSWLWLLLDNVVSIVAALAASVAAARVLGPDKIGYYNYAIWASQMVKLVADMGVPLATRKFVSEYRGRGDQEMVHTIVRLAGRFQRMVTLVVVPLSMLGVLGLAQPTHWPFALLTMASLAPQILIGASASVLWASGNLRFSVTASVAGCLTNLAGVGLTLGFGWDLTGLAAVGLVSRLVDLAIRQRYVRRLLAAYPPARPRLDPELKARMVRFCWHQTVLLATEVVIWNRSELFLLEEFSTIRQVAFFSLTFNLVQYFLLFPQMMSAAAGATMMVRQGQAPHTVGPMAATSMWFIFIFAVPAAFGLAAVSGPLMAVAYGAEYLEAIPVMGLLAAFGVARALSYPVLEVLFVVEKQGLVVRLSLAMILVNAALGLLWIPSGGAVGAAFTKGVVQLVTLVGLWAYAAHAVKLRLPLGRSIKLVVSSAAMALAVRALVTPLPPAAGLVLGIPAGVVLLAVALRITGCLDQADRERLASLQKVLPGRLRPGFLGVLRAVIPG